MASAPDHTNFEIPCKRRKIETDEINSSEKKFQIFSSTSNNHIDVCEGTSTDSGFNESDTDKDTRTCNTPKHPKKVTSDAQLIERIFAMRGIIDEKLWLELTCQLFTPPPRQRLLHISRFVDAIRLIRSSRKILVLTGAGVSVSCGIPDFRSRDGIYARLAQDFPDLPDPHAMFDSTYFRQDPRPFFKFAKEIYPGRFKPSRSHAFIKSLESHNRLLRNYTQNIDTLERAAGINRVIECHGSFAQATCTRCQFEVDAEEIREDIFEQRIPICKNCNPGCSSVTATDSSVNYSELVENGVMKPNITFFGEDLPSKFYRCIQADRTDCDLLLVIGSSLKVRPVAEVPTSLPPDVPQILINRERLPHCTFDVELLGDSDVIVNQICHRLGEGWKEDICEEPLKRTKMLNRPSPQLIPTISSHTFPKYRLDTAPDSSFATEDEGSNEYHEDLPSYSYENSLHNTSEMSSATVTSYPESGEESNNFIETFSTNSNRYETFESSEDEIMVQRENTFMPPSIMFDEDTGNENTCATTVSNDSMDVNRSETMVTLDYNSSVNMDTYDDKYEELRKLFKDRTPNSKQSNFPPKVPALPERHNSVDSGIVDDYELARAKVNVSDCLPKNTFFFRPPNKYIFPGAEVKIKCKYLKFMK